MDKDQKKHDGWTAGNGYCLLPWGEHFREGNWAAWSDAALAVLPVIAAHANRNGEAWPGYGRICALTKTSKSTVARAIDSLVADGWIEVARRHGKYDQNLYRLCFRYDKNNDALDYNRQWIRLDHKLIKRGTWGAMTHATRRVYLIFRAFAWAGLSAIPLGYNGPGYTDPEAHEVDGGEPINVRVRGKWKEFCFTEVEFLPEHIYDPATFAELSGVPTRTFRDARTWLIDNGIICPYVYDEDADEEDRIAGFIIPFKPGIYFQHVLDKVEKAKEESAARYKATPGGKRSFAALLHRAGLGKTAPSTR